MYYFPLLLIFTYVNSITFNFVNPDKPYRKKAKDVQKLSPVQCLISTIMQEIIRFLRSW